LDGAPRNIHALFGAKLAHKAHGYCAYYESIFIHIHAMQQVIVQAHNPHWATDFAAEADQIRGQLQHLAPQMHHIGSTAIAGIYAKPVIDMLLVVTDLRALDTANARMQSLGYEVMGEFGIPGRRYFRKNSAQGTRTHHVHAFAVGDANIERHLAFRDYMNRHPAAAAAYSALKQRLAAMHASDIDAYIDGKDAFIKAYEAKALTWRALGAGD
jgi:GrpB-like predicted nucleotidyltransferase (UPF0157 family)